MKILITPIGGYLGRILKGIASIKPDEIYFCVQKRTKTKTPEEKEVIDKWVKATRKYVKDIIKKIRVFYEDEKIKIIELNIYDYLSIFEELLRIILKYDRRTEIYLDSTSTTFHFRIAALTLSIFLRNVKLIYTPSERPKLPEDYTGHLMTDKGLEPIVVPVPRLDISELQKGELRKILLVIHSRFKDRAPSITDIALEIGLPNTKGTMIKMSKLIDKLEKYGCVKTEKEGRIKKVTLTMIGKSLAEVFQKFED